MIEESDRRAAQTEALFRDANEAIERGLWPEAEGRLVRFRCECARLDCHDMIVVPIEEYELVRQDPRQFLLLPGHDCREREIVIDEQPGYVVVEKMGVAGQEAERLDPRTGQDEGRHPAL